MTVWGPGGGGGCVLGKREETEALRGRGLAHSHPGTGSDSPGGCLAAGPWRFGPHDASTGRPVGHLVYVLGAALSLPLGLSPGRGTLEGLF